MERTEVLDLEEGYPTVEQAVQKLASGLASAKARGVRFVKVITGWGSHGKGGAIHRALPTQLARLMAKGLAKEWVPGERWEIFDRTYQSWFQLCPDLSRDRDLCQYNQGICWVRVK